ncbi:hypothetical protein GRF29_44g490237 [Pseudopithomyces chartarum]|uniref:Uncharacterized protein n=1 Tax=Pseudopithomyces chartarum TaxID=1892770 RepID=A0AAN6RI98_9PLEO|nr:hypothetical protein GRF29_44g490237 [Pseudopithomyces chartarum]
MPNMPNMPNFFKRPIPSTKSSKTHDSENTNTNDKTREAHDASSKEAPPAPTPDSRTLIEHIQACLDLYCAVKKAHSKTSTRVSSGPSVFYSSEIALSNLKHNCKEKAEPASPADVQTIREYVTEVEGGLRKYLDEMGLNPDGTSMDDPDGEKWLSRQGRALIRISDPIRERGCELRDFLRDLEEKQRQVNQSQR